RTLSIAAVVVPLIGVVIAILSAAGVPALDDVRARATVWLPGGQAAGVHLLLGVAIFASLRPNRGLGGLRVFGLVAAVLAIAVSVSAYAFAGHGYTMIPGVEPMSALVSITTAVATLGITVIAPGRWPVRALVQRASDRVMVRHLLPFVLLTPIIGMILLTSARHLGADDEPRAVLATAVPSLALFGLVAVAVRDHRQLASEIESRDSQLLSVLDGLPVAVMLRAADGTLLHLNPEAERFLARLGVDRSVVHPGPAALLDHLEVIDELGKPQTPDELPVVTAIRDGKSNESTLGYALPEKGHAWYSVRSAPVPLGDGTTGIIVTLDDVTEPHIARQRVALAERSLRLTFDHAPIGIAVLAPDGRLLQVNAALCALLGYDEAQLLAAGLEAATHPDERDDHAELLASWLCSPEERDRVDRRLRHRDGHWVLTQMSIALVRDAQGAPLHFIAQVVDFTERRALEEELRAAAVQDPLTGLANRRALAEGLASAQQGQARAGGHIGLLFIDLDGFKAVNDRYGHAVGDLLLIETGRQLRAATRGSDTVCRLGGDEFVVLCAPIDGHAGLRFMIDRLELMRTVVPTGEGSVSVEQSIGAVLVEPAEDLDATLRRADAAMYRKKRERTSNAEP
ncbi:MAG: diguanylate cyclase, partial [Egibacteraceae bacterium]